LVFQPWSVAATLLLLLISAVFFLTNKMQKQEVAQSENTFDFPAPQDTLIIYQKPAIVLVHSPSIFKSKRGYDASEPVLRSGKPVYQADDVQTQQDSRVAATEEKSLGPMASAPALKKAMPEAAPATAREMNKPGDADLSAAEVPALVTVSGKVKSAEDGVPLPGVNVVAKGLQAGATTDSDGNFVLSVPQGTDTLVFNFVGMIPAKIALRNRNNLEVSMQADIKSLSEVVVVGDEGAKRKALPGNDPEPNPQLDEYVEQNLRYPEPARQLKVKGTVGLEFTVEPDGSLSDFKVTKSLGYGCDEEAVRLLREGPKWKPALENKQPSRKRVKTKIRFGN
jgi:TonB family protein